MARSDLDPPANSNHGRDEQPEIKSTDSAPDSIHQVNSFRHPLLEHEVFDGPFDGGERHLDHANMESILATEYS